MTNANVFVVTEFIGLFCKHDVEDTGYYPQLQLYLEELLSEERGPCGHHIWLSNTVAERSDYDCSVRCSEDQRHVTWNPARSNASTVSPIGTVRGSVASTVSVILSCTANAGTITGAVVVAVMPSAGAVMIALWLREPQYAFALR